MRCRSQRQPIPSEPSHQEPVALTYLTYLMRTIKSINLHRHHLPAVSHLEHSEGHVFVFLFVFFTSSKSWAMGYISGRTHYMWEQMDGVDHFCSPPTLFNFQLQLWPLSHPKVLWFRHREASSRISWTAESRTVSWTCWPAKELVIHFYRKGPREIAQSNTGL